MQLISHVRSGVLSHHLQVLKKLVDVNLRVFMNCQSKLSEMPLKRYNYFTHTGRPGRGGLCVRTTRCCSGKKSLVLEVPVLQIGSGGVKVSVYVLWVEHTPVTVSKGYAVIEELLLCNSGGLYNGSIQQVSLI